MPLVTSRDSVWTDSQLVSCRGDNQEGLGHPVVYYTLTKERQTICAYCGRVFCLKEKKEDCNDKSENK